MKRILYISYDGMTDPLGGSQVLPYLKGISLKGYHITVISFEKPARFNGRENAIAEDLASFSIDWHPQVYHKSPAVLSTLFDLAKLFYVVNTLHQKQPFDLVHCRSYVAAFGGSFLKSRYKVKFLFDIRGFWVDERVDGHIWSLKNPLFRLIYKFFKKKEREWFSDADHIVSLTSNAKNYLIGHFGLPKDRISVIPCCTDTQLFHMTDDQSAVLVELNIPATSYIVGYLGSFGTWYLMEEMLVYFRAVLNVKPDSFFVVYTVDSTADLFSFAKKLEIPLDRIRTKEVERSKLSRYLSVFDISLCFVQPSFSKIASSPTKIGELLSAGIPLVCNSQIGDNELLFKDSNVSLLINDFDDGSIAESVDILLKTSFKSSDCRIFAIEHFELSIGVAEYCRVYERLLK